MTDAFNIFKSTDSSSQGNSYPPVNDSPLKNEVTMAKQSGGVKKRIIVRKGNAYIPLGLSSIAVFYHHKVTFAVDFSGNKYLVEENLYNIEKMLDACMFFRVNRRMILNIDAIKEYRTIEYGKISIQLISPDWIKEVVSVSQFTAPFFKQWIAQL